MTQRRIGMIGHLDHGKTSLAAALVRVLAHGIRVRENCSHCGGRGDVGPARTPEGDWEDQPCPRCAGSGEEPRGHGELTDGETR